MTHRFPCSDDSCDFCLDRAEDRAMDAEPDFDESAAADSYEAAMGW
jgi:hypothetical protein